MIASEEPCVRAPVVSPGALNRLAIMRMQRCSISAVCGYSAWSMKLRWRFAAMIWRASGSIHVVTKVARLRIGSPSSSSSSPIRRIASIARMPCSGSSWSGDGLAQEAVAVRPPELVELGCQARLGRVVQGHVRTSWGLVDSDAGQSITAPARKHAAPRLVAQLAAARSRIDPVAGTK